MERLNERAMDVTELTDADLDRVAGGGLLHVVRVIFIPGTSSAPGGTGTDNGPTGTNGQAWVTSVS
jgi:hypothetical protein